MALLVCDSGFGGVEILDCLCFPRRSDFGSFLEAAQLVLGLHEPCSKGTYQLRTTGGWVREATEHDDPELDVVDCVDAFDLDWRDT